MTMDGNNDETSMMESTPPRKVAANVGSLNRTSVGAFQIPANASLASGVALSVPPQMLVPAQQQQLQQHQQIAGQGQLNLVYPQHQQLQLQQHQQQLQHQQQIAEQALLASTYNPFIAQQAPQPNIASLLHHPYQSGQIHNLIPSSLQPSAQAPSLDGSPGHQPALILPGIVPAVPPNVAGLVATATNQILLPVLPVLTVQDRPMVPPVYNGVNPNYPGLRVINHSPPVFCVDNFLTPYECDFLIHSASDAFERAPVVGKGVGEVSPSRTSSTCYLAREDLPDYMRKVSLLTGKPIEHCELPQVGQYMPTQQYLQHFDAFDLSNEDGRRFAANGGQRVITVLVYLNDVEKGGETSFPALNLNVRPRKGTALVFFPSTVDGLLDKAALHAALPAVDVKYVSQVWIRQSTYNGQPSKRLAQTLGVPFSQAPLQSLPAATMFQ